MSHSNAIALLTTLQSFVKTLQNVNKSADIHTFCQ